MALESYSWSSAPMDDEEDPDPWPRLGEHTRRIFVRGPVHSSLYIAGPEPIEFGFPVAIDSRGYAVQASDDHPVNSIVGFAMESIPAGYTREEALARELLDLLDRGPYGLQRAKQRLREVLRKVDDGESG